MDKISKQQIESAVKKQNKGELSKEQKLRVIAKAHAMLSSK